MTADTVGGVWTYVLELCAALGDSVEFVIATLGPAPTRAQRAGLRHLPNVQLECSDYSVEWMRDAVRDIELSGEWLRTIEQRVKPDVIHFNGYAHAALGWDVPVVVAAHSCVLSWWRAVHGRDAPAEWSIYRGYVAAGLAAAECVVAPSRSFLAELRRIYGDLGEAHVIHHARTEPCPHDLAQERLEFVFAAGRSWDPARNIRTLDLAAHRLSWPVYVAGDSAGPDGTEIGHDSVVPLGRIAPERMFRWMQSAPIYVHPALYEPFGLSVLEAALAGCALVLSDIPTLHELWEDAAVFVPARDPARLREVLEELIEDEDYRMRLSAAARRRSGRYSVRRMAVSYRALYDDLTVEGWSTSPVAHARNPGPGAARSQPAEGHLS
jgi:glycosyltransferase involved in cell wall biosynthesis